MIFRSLPGSKKMFQIGLILFLFFFAISPQTASAQGAPQAWSGVCVGSQIAGGDDVATIQGLQCLLANLFSVTISGIGLAGFVMMIWASFRWLVSGGQSKGVEAARNTMTWAVIGLVVALSSVFILNLIAQFTGVNVIMDFAIPADTNNIPGF